MLICYSLYCEYNVENSSSISFPSERETDDKVSHFKLEYKESKVGKIRSPTLKKHEESSIFIYSRVT